MWVEHWSKTHQRPFYACVETGERRWDAPNTAPAISEGYDSVIGAAGAETDELAMKTLRTFHNAVKRALITFASAGRTGLRVMDVCCGKGGDMHKWRPYAQEVHGFDGARECVAEATRRAQVTGNGSPCVFRYVVHDARRDKPAAWASLFGEETHAAYDVVSAQFCVHYFFSSRDLALHFFRRCRESTLPGGTMIMTYVDEEVLSRRLFPASNSDDVPSEGSAPDDVPSEGSAPDDLCRLTTTVPKRAAVPYPYVFGLAGCVPDLAEHAIPREVLRGVLRDTGWDITRDETLLAFAEASCPTVPSDPRVLRVSGLYRVGVLTAC